MPGPRIKILHILHAAKKKKKLPSGHKKVCRNLLYFSLTEMTVCSLALDFSLDALRSGVLSPGKAPLSVAGGQHAPGISRPAELAG